MEYTFDWQLLENYTTERSVTHKLAEYLQVRIPYLDVDCEYNRNVENGNNEPTRIELLKAKLPKILWERLKDEDKLSISSYPDMILHRRTKNLLVVEMKKTNSQVGQELDFAKLETFSEKGGVNAYHYRYGVFVLINTGPNWEIRAKLTWFIVGKIYEDF